MGDLNGRVALRDDFHYAADALYGELQVLPWFVGIERRESERILVVEAKDVEAAKRWLGDRSWFGWTFEIRRSKKMARKAVS